jgi:hypothetical protein
MSNDRRSYRTAVALFALAVIIAAVVAFITTSQTVATRHVEAQPGTIGLARPHAPLVPAPAEAVRN